MSLAKLTSVSTLTLSLLLERQRLHTLPSFSATSDPNAAKPPSLHLPQITKNLKRLRSGIIELEEKEGRSEAVILLRSQYERMRAMLGKDSNAVERYVLLQHVEMLEQEDPSASSSSPSPSPPSSLAPTPPPKPPAKDTEPVYSPYTDDPEAGYHESGIMLQTQRRMMDEQDEQLDRLSHSINRQHHISLQINDELDVHTGLLEELDTELDRTESRLTGARRRLDKVARGAKNNGSTVTIGLLIFVLLILIIIFKT
ncbi:syntaxin-like protein [Lyophyllum atratum]|nr:syntaxin-like protein [Lyophyllum atratum]